MKKLYPSLPAAIYALLFSFFIVSTSSAQEVIYYEDFSQGIPDSYIVQDIDGLTVVSGLDSSSIDDFPFDGGWVTQINFDDPTDTIAASSSWYNPPGISNDWLITDQISIPDTGTFYLQWRSMALSSSFPDGYEVYISTSGTSIADFTDLVFSIPEEISTWITRKVSLADYAGQDIHIGFRNNSDDKLILFLDDIYIADAAATVNGDPAILFTEFPDIYTSAPLGQLDTFFLSATIANLGNTALEDTFGMTAVIFDPFPDVPIFAQTLQGPTVPFDTLEVGTFEGIPRAFVPIDTGLHVIGYLINSNEQDVLPENDFTQEAFANDLAFEVVDVSDTVLARDEGTLSNNDPFWELPSTLFGENHRSIYGSVYFLVKADVLTSITAFFGSTGENIGDELFAQVYDDSLRLIAQSNSYTITADDTTGISGVNFSFAQGSVNKKADIPGVSLSPGLYLMALQGGAYLPMAMSDNIFLDAGTWFSSDSLAAGGTWFSTEDLKPFIDSIIVDQGGNALFNDERVFVIQANMAGCSSLDGLLDITNDDGSGNGSVAVMPTGGQLPYSYAWSDSGPLAETDSILAGLSQGRYSVVIEDGRGCEFELFATVSLGTSTQDPIDLGFSRFQAYPNPAVHTLNIDMTLENPDQIHLSLLDIQGRVVSTQSFEHRLSVETQIPTDKWPAGIYLLQVQTSKGMVHKRIMLR